MSRYMMSFIVVALLTICILGCAGLAGNRDETNHVYEPPLTTRATSADVMSRMQVSHDSVDKLNWYLPNEDMYFKLSGMRRPATSRVLFYVEQSTEGGSPTIYIHPIYIGSSWIFASHVRGLIDTVETRRRDFVPFRPGVSPWKNSGLSAQLRPDFKARKITDRPERETKSPPDWHKKD